MKLRLAAALLFALGVWAQAPVPGIPAVTGVEVQDAEMTKNQLSQLLERYPPGLRYALAADSTLLSNEQYLAPYPALAGFLKTHPEVARDSGFYLDHFRRRTPPDRSTQIIDIWRDVLQGIALFAGFFMAAGMIIWLTRTFLDARRWNRMAKVQTEVHMKLLDRFSTNEELLAYVQSPAGSRFLESAPITLDAPPQRTVGAPVARILWSLQGGVVILAGGIGLLFVSARVALAEAADPLRGLGIVAIALGIGFILSAAMSYLISRRLGLIDIPGRSNSVQSLS